MAIVIISIVVFRQAAVGKAIKVTSTVMKDTKHNSALAQLTYEDMENAGFVHGDSCDVSFGNGYSLNDVPYYDG